MAANRGLASKEDKAYHPDLVRLSFILSIASFHVKWLQNLEHQPLDSKEKKIGYELMEHLTRLNGEC
ncbi:unnamed protein product [Arabis nemorensis]|uniref:Uncharacterized protein n=1 Tax=Arabis nemorensis TaxID=586526 RepID=A0A565APL5_9BRAS|nr:unnamed protein product [Arabis nemorensis]